MKYSIVVALFLGSVSATKLNGGENHNIEEFKFDGADHSCSRNRIHEMVDTIRDSGVGALADKYLEDGVKTNLNKNADTFKFEDVT